MSNDARRQYLQRRLWNPFYDRLARFYDLVDWGTGNTTHRLRRRAFAYLPAPGSRVLEIGFGTGRLHQELARSFHLFGLDRAYGMADLTQSRLATDGLRSNLCVGSVYDLPWPANQFDAVLSTFAFSAFADADRAIDEMIRVSCSDGRILIVDAGEAMNDNRMARLLARAWEWAGDYMRDERPLLVARGLQVQREDYGPWGCVHVTVGMMSGQGSQIGRYE